MKKLLAYFIDYIWFSLFLTSLLLKFNYTIIPLLIVLVFTPLLFTPFDALFIKLTRTSIGKALFAQYTFENESISFKKALIQAFRQGVFNQIILVPIVNIVLFKWIKRLNLPLTTKKRNFKEKALSIFTIIMMLGYACFSNEMIVQKTKNYFVEHKIEKKDITPESSWFAQNDTEKNYTAYFPTKINTNSLEIEVPNSTRVLNLKTYSSKYDNITYSLTQTRLPSSWTKWGNKLVLNGALKALVKHENGTILSQKNCIIQKRNAIEFTMKVGQNLKSGRLIMDKNMIYKVEGIYACDLPIESRQEESIDEFINLFSLHS